MANASVVWRSDDKEVIASLQKMESKYEKALEKIKLLTQGSKESAAAAKEGASSAGSAIGNWAGSLTQLAAGYLGLNALMAAGNKLLQDQIDLENKSADKQRSVADEQLKFLRNLGAVSRQERSDRLAQAKEIASSTGVTEKSLYPSLTVAMSAKGTLSNQQSMEFARIAARVAPEDSGEMAALTGGLLDSASLTKSGDPRANLGFMAAMQQQARVTTLAQTSQNLVPAAISVANLGGTPEEAAALATTFTSGMKDSTGALSRTASISLAQQVKDFTPGGVAEDIKFLQENEGARKRFLAKATFEKASDSFSRDLLTPGTEMARLYEQNKGGFPSADGRVAAADEFMAGIREPELQGRAAYSRRTDQLEEHHQLQNLGLGDFSRYNDRIRRVSDAVGIPGVYSAANYALGRLNYFATGDAEQSAAQRVAFTVPDLQKEQERAEARGDSGQANYFQRSVNVLLDVVKELQEIKRNQVRPTVNLHGHHE